MQRRLHRARREGAALRANYEELLVTSTLIPDFLSDGSRKAGQQFRSLDELVPVRAGPRHVPQLSSQAETGHARFTFAPRLERLQPSASAPPWRWRARGLRCERLDEVRHCTTP